MNLWEVIRDRAGSRPDQPAVSMGQARMTFADLLGRAERLSLALAKEGVSGGRAAALVLPNSPAFVTVFLALVKLSAPAALVSPNFGSSGWTSIAEGIRPQCFITTSSLAEVLRPSVGIGKASTLSIPGLGDDLTVLFPPSIDRASNASPADAPREGLRDSDVLVKFTSGSTGEPKGIPWTAENVMAEALNVASTLDLRPADAVLAAVPIFHSYGFDLGVLPMLFSGTELILRDQFIPRRILADLAAPRVKVFLGVPSMYRVWIEAPPAARPSLSAIPYLLSCTAPLHPDIIAKFHEGYGASICQHYGSSETGAATTHIPGEVLARPDSVGVPMTNVEIEIVDDQGTRLPEGTEGEVIIRSRAVARGYIMGRPTGPLPFRNGAYWTGDMGALDDRGFLFLRGRKDDLINVGGLKVYPEEIRRVLERFPAVKEAAVLGVEDARGEEVVVAVVSLKSAATENEILRFCRQYLLDYKIPRRIEIRDELPRGPGGKVRLRKEDFRR